MSHADSPRAGYYLIRRVRNGPFVPVHIWYGPTPDPDFPDNPQDRSPCWHAVRDGKEVPVEYVWPWADRNEIDEAEYRYRMEGAAWDRTNDPSAPAANPHTPVDLNSAKPVF